MQLNKIPLHYQAQTGCLLPQITIDLLFHRIWVTFISYVEETSLQQSSRKDFNASLMTQKTGKIRCLHSFIVTE